jgi:hypothetical protein
MLVLLEFMGGDAGAARPVVSSVTVSLGDPLQRVGFAGVHPAMRL